MKNKVDVGDVFLIPLDAAGFGVGQVAGNWNGELYFLIYDAAYPTREVDPKLVISQTPLFAALSLDAKIFHGDWPIIGNVTENLGSIPQPAFKVNQEGRVFLESRDRSVSRPATCDEDAALRFRNVVAPIRLENALKAHKGIGDWNPKYEDLRFKYALESSRFVAN